MPTPGPCRDLFDVFPEVALLVELLVRRRHDAADRSKDRPRAILRLRRRGFFWRSHDDPRTALDRHEVAGDNLRGRSHPLCPARAAGSNLPRDLALCRTAVIAAAAP